MSLPIQPLTDDVSVAPQLTPEAMTEVASAGYRSVINNRPDFEGGPAQPTSASIEAAALAAGLTYAWLPVASNFQSPDDIGRFAALLDSMPKPILAFCRSGTRSGNLLRGALAL